MSGTNYVSTFVLDDTEVVVKDAEARNDIASQGLELANVKATMARIENLSRLTMSYNGTTETLTFSSTTH